MERITALKVLSIEIDQAEWPHSNALIKGREFPSASLFIDCHFKTQFGCRTKKSLWSKGITGVR
jgi:hypothetical protein